MSVPTPDFEYLRRSSREFVRHLVPGSAALTIAGVVLLLAGATCIAVLPLRTGLMAGAGCFLGTVLLLSLAAPRARNPLLSSRAALAGVVSFEPVKGGTAFRVVVGKAAADHSSPDAAARMAELTHTSPGDRPPPYDRGPLPRIHGTVFVAERHLPAAPDEVPVLPVLISGGHGEREVARRTSNLLLSLISLPAVVGVEFTRNEADVLRILRPIPGDFWNAALAEDARRRRELRTIPEAQETP